MSGHWLFDMTRLQILFFVALPLCAAQFRIQGPSDGNRRAQGLKYDRSKGIQYDDQRDSLGTGDFTIQGASDGNSDFKIQGASDGNSDFQIHGATDGNANFHIQGATDSNAQFQIQGATDGNANIQGATDGRSAVQGPYDLNQGSGRSLQYRDPSGLRVNWKSYQNAVAAQPQQQAQYAPVPAPAPAPRRKAHRQQYQQQAAAAPAPPVENNNYKVFDKTPPQIQQILQFQQQIPYLNIIPQQYRFDVDHAAQSPAPRQHQQQQEVAPESQEERPLRNQHQRGRSRGPARQKREAQHQRHQQQPQQQPQLQSHGSAPSRIQELLKFQSQIPYVNHIPEQWRYEALLSQQGKLPEPQYQRAPEPVSVRHSQRVRQRREAQHYNPNLPAHLQQLVKFLEQTPYTSNIPPHIDVEKLRAEGLRQQGYRQKREAQNYNPNLPAHLQQLVKFLEQTPYTSNIPPHIDVEKLRAEGLRQQGYRQKREAQQYKTNLPGHLQQLLKFQAQTPYTSNIPPHINFDKLLTEGERQKSGQRQKRAAQQPDLSQYRRIAQPPAESLPQYSTNVPSSIQQLLKFQSQTPYDIIANRINVRLDKPYVPQLVQPSAAATPAYQPAQQNPQQLPQQPIYQRPAQQQPVYQNPQQPVYQRPVQQPVYPQQLPQQPVYQRPAQPEQPQQYQQPQLQRPLYQPAPIAQHQPQQIQSPLLPSQSPQYSQYNQQSQLLRPQYHPNQIPQGAPQQYQSAYGAGPGVRPVTENQY